MLKQYRHHPSGCHLGGKSMRIELPYGGATTRRAATKGDSRQDATLAYRKNPRYGRTVGVSGPGKSAGTFWVTLPVAAHSAPR